MDISFKKNYFPARHATFDFKIYHASKVLSTKNCPARNDNFDLFKNYHACKV